MIIETVNIIGKGNVGTHLAGALGAHVKGVASKRADDMADLSPEVDLNIVCVNDDQVRTVAEQLPEHVPVVHTSGSVGIDVFGSFEHYGILYPLQTFSKDRLVELREVPFLLEASDDLFYNALQEFCQRNLSNTVLRVNSEKRARIHLAAVFANNFSTLMLHEAEQILNDVDLSLDLLRPLLTETVGKAMNNGAKEALTGPARRGDVATIQKQLAAITDPELKEIYQLLTDRIRKL